MRLPFELLSLAAALVLSSTPLIAASSAKRNPIGSIATVRNATIHTNQHRVTALSHFDLTFYARDDLYVKFSLEPNHDILAPDTLISHLGADGVVTHTEHVDRLGHKVFKGTAWVYRPGLDGHNWQSVGWARASIYQDGKEPFFEGAFSVYNNYHHIQSSTNYLQTKHDLDPEIDWLKDGEEYMILWRDSDIQPLNQFEHEDLRRRRDEDIPSCHYDDMVFNRNPEHPVLLGASPRSSRSFGASDFSYLLGRRQIDSTTGGNAGAVDLKSTIGQTEGCPTERKVALVGVATDCTYTDALGSKSAVTKNVVSQMNQASGIWEGAFSISLGLQNLTISEAACPGSPQQATLWNQDCSDSVDIQDRLNYFSAWRADQGGDNSHWTLLSTCNTGSAVGLAWLGQACVGTAINSNGSETGSGPSRGGQAETVSGANVVIRTNGANEWAIIAHETGHTFGAVHDCDSQTCGDQQYVASQQCCPKSATTCDAGGGYIMNPFTEPGVNAFSPCSIGNICSAIGRKSVDTSCLSDNRNVETFTGQQCGNGIVEPGEDCDCGGSAGCGDDPCCNPDTCKFNDGAVCDDANESCCSNCQFSSKGSVCRPSTGVCDPEEVCPGNGGDCPSDKTKEGEDCGNGLQCISGQCTSRDQQCKTVMGSYSSGNDTSACNSQDCTISCKSPSSGFGQCYGLQQNFLDGTPCSGSGHCENGQCKGASFGGEVGSWIDDHKTIVIPIVSVVGALILLCIIGSCWRRHKRRKMRRKQVPPPPPPGWNGWGGATTNNHHRGFQQYPPNQGGWYAPQQNHHYTAPPPPPPPPPVMSGARGGVDHWAPPPVPPPGYGSGSDRGPVRYG